MFSLNFLRSVIISVVLGACASARATPSVPTTPSASASAATSSTAPEGIAEPIARRLPITNHRKVTFKWDFEGNEMVARGDGVVRIAPPDSTRLDFFLAGGFGAGAAILVGDSLTLPPGAMSGAVRDMLPPTQFLWETLKKIVTSDSTKKVFNVNYGSPLDRRKLKLIITNDETSSPFSQDIWRF